MIDLQHKKPPFSSRLINVCQNKADPSHGANFWERSAPARLDRLLPDRYLSFSLRIPAGRPRSAAHVIRNSEEDYLTNIRPSPSQEDLCLSAEHYNSWPPPGQAAHQEGIIRSVPCKTASPESVFCENTSFHSCFHPLREWFSQKSISPLHTFIQNGRGF